MSSERKAQFDVSRLSDFEIFMLIIERDVAQFKVGQIDELLNQYGQAKGYIDSEKESPSSKAGFVKEITFSILTFDNQKGSRLGDFQVAYKAKNLPEKFSPAYGILKANNATIANRYRGPNYNFSYWLFNAKDRIYRQKVKTIR